MSFREWNEDGGRWKIVGEKGHKKEWRRQRERERERAEVAGWERNRVSKMEKRRGKRGRRNDERQYHHSNDERRYRPSIKVLKIGKRAFTGTKEL